MERKKGVHTQQRKELWQKQEGVLPLGISKDSVKLEPGLKLGSDLKLDGNGKGARLKKSGYSLRIQRIDKNRQIH